MTEFTRRVQARPDVMMRQVGGEAIILNLETEAYYGLDDVGTRMWALLTTEPTIQTAYERLLDEYEIDAETLHSDLERLIEELSVHGLITLIDG